MTEDFTTEALLYLLDDLDPERRAAFEERLTRDPVAAAAFKNCADTFAQFALEASPDEMLSEDERRASFAGILAATNASAAERKAEQKAARRSSVILFSRWAWPVAAALLLGLNVAQFFEAPGSRGSSALNGRDGSGETQTAAVGVDGGASAGPRAIALTPHGRGTSGTTDAAKDKDGRGRDAATAAVEPGGALAAEQMRLSDLQREFTALQRARDTLDLEYEQALRKLAQRALSGQGVGQLSTMELVDADSYARGDRKGLMSLARKLLTEPGIVADTPTPVPTPLLSGGIDGGIVVTGASTGAVVGAISLNGAVSGVDLAYTTAGSVVGTPAVVAPTPTPTPTSQTGNDTPYAWSVFDEKERQGFLNLYNLPKVTANQSLQVWVKPLDSQEYRAVGEVPAEFYGKSGAVSYALPAGTATPTEVMITLEPRQTVAPTKPSGPVVLRGP